MDSLNLQYIEGHGILNVELKTFMMPAHLSLDIYYVRKFGEKEGYHKFKEDLTQELDLHKYATVLVHHPEWFVRSVGGHGLIYIPLTIMRIKMMNKIYSKFIREFINKAKFMRYLEMFQILSK